MRYTRGSRGPEETAEGPTARTRSVYHGPNVAQELNASNTPTFNLITGLAPDQVFWRSGGTNATTDSVLTDALGSTLATTTPAATPAIRTSFTYEPFGKPSATTFPYLFTGRDYDAATGLQYNRARTYAPAYGRFTSEDPIGILGGSANPYLYAANAPTVFTDPFGLEPGELGWALTGLLADVASVIASYWLFGATIAGVVGAPVVVLGGALLLFTLASVWATASNPGFSSTDIYTTLGLASAPLAVGAVVLLATLSLPAAGVAIAGTAVVASLISVGMDLYDLGSS